MERAAGGLNDFKHFLVDKIIIACDVNLTNVWVKLVQLVEIPNRSIVFSGHAIAYYHRALQQR